MRISTVTLFGLALSDKPKAPPRHPKYRLRTLIKFGKEWVRANLWYDCDDDSKACIKSWKWNDRFTTRFDKWGAKLTNTLTKDCFYYDPNNPTGHGGRDRREDEDEDDYATDDYDYTAKADDLIRYDRNNPMRGIKQIMTGFRKWSTRYISECAGQVSHKYHASRADKLRKKLQTKYGILMKLKGVL